MRAGVRSLRDSTLSISFRNRLPISSAVSVGLSVWAAGAVMAAGSCAGNGEAGGLEWAQPERITADETRSSAARRRGLGVGHELILRSFAWACGGVYPMRIRRGRDGRHEAGRAGWSR